MRDENKPYRASNGEEFTDVPGGIERVWWTVGAEDRLNDSRNKLGNHTASQNLMDAWAAGWQAMDERLEKTADSQIVREM